MQLNPQKLSLAALIATSVLSIAALWLGLQDLGLQKLGTVDLQGILAEQSQKLAQAYPTGQVPPKIMQRVVEDIKGVIELYGQDQKITLLAKSAVLSGTIPEHTNAVKEILNETKLQTLRGQLRGRS